MTQFSRFSTRAAAVVLVTAMLPGIDALAQSPPASTPPAKATAKPPAKPVAPAAAAPAPPSAVIPDTDKTLLLIRTTLLTLNDALRTGNFTVLRDVSAPGFRDANSAAKLTLVFSDLLRRGIELSRVAIMVPQMSVPPAIDAQSGMLRLTGTFPGQPAGIAFDMLFQPVTGRWMMFGLSVNPVQMAVQAPPGDAPAPPAAAPSPQAPPTPSPPAKPN